MSFFDDFVHDFFRYFFVVEEFHIERTFALGHGAQDGDVVFHFCQRDLGFNDDDAFAVAMVFHAEDAAAAAAEVAHDIAHVIFRDDDVDVVNRFQEDRLGFGYGFLEGLSGSDFEGHFRRIDRMIGTIGQGDFDVDHGEAGDEAFFQSFTDAFFNGRDVLFRYGAAKDLIDEFKGFACRQRLDVQEDVAELTVAAALFLVFAFGCRLALDSFTIRDVDVFLFGFDTVFPFDLGQDVVEVDVAHAADDELFAFGDRPLYTRLQRDVSRAWCESDLWLELTHAERVQCVAEEAYVIAAERMLIPGRVKWSMSRLAYYKAVCRICTTLTSGWFRDFAIDNFDSVMALHIQEKFGKVREILKI